ncbi:hypothetical protein [Ruminococcus flavefaciens]|uniref:hypothetical protein n=1 Tax=Ruminococcus flavefaciens TaxID=1265 RepID=UPI001564C6B6|nr:hypothetical protein [Ruminococcus flavefaciens]
MKDKYYKRIGKAIEKCNSINCYLKHDDTYFNIIPLCRNDTFVLAANDNDFLINGFMIIPIKNIRQVDSKGKKYNEIIHKESITDEIKVPEIDMDSYASIFTYFFNEHTAISMDTVDGFYIGNVEDIGKKYIRFSYFDARGKRYKPVKITYDDILVIYLKDRYTEVFSKYVK